MSKFLPLAQAALRDSVTKESCWFLIVCFCSLFSVSVFLLYCDVVPRGSASARGCLEADFYLVLDFSALALALVLRVGVLALALAFRVGSLVPSLVLC